MQEVIRYAILNGGGRIRWRFPNRSVLCHRQSPLDLDRLRGQYGLRRQFEQTKRLAVITSDATVRHIRTGAARDVAHLEDQSSVGVSSKAVAAQPGHNADSYHEGVTDGYVSAAESYFYNRRVEADHFDGLAPVVARKPMTQTRKRRLQSRLL